MKRSVIILFAFILWSASANAFSYSYEFKDAVRPGGHRRSDAVLHAAGRACGASEAYGENVAAFKKCMRAHGWRFQHLAVRGSPTPLARESSIWDFVGVGADDQDSRNFQAAMDAERQMDEQQRNSGN